MRRRRPTSKQVAERAGVSRTTVSFVLNGVEGASISEATRQRVLAAASALGYVPDAAARTLASGSARTIGLVVCHSAHLVTDAVIPQVLYGLNEVSRARGFRVMVEAVEDLERPDAYVDLVRAKQIDGLVAINPRSDDRQLPKLIGGGFPVVVIGNPDLPDALSVDVDNREAAYRATAHLLASGRRRIAHVTYGPLGYQTVRERLEGYQAGLQAGGAPSDPSLVAIGDYSAASGRSAMSGLLDAARQRGAALPDAVFAGNDTVALGVIDALRQRGARVPDDVAVVGFDDIPIAAHVQPPLTTLRLPATAMGRMAGAALIDLVQGQAPPMRRKLLPCPLVVRASCGSAGEGRGKVG